VARRSPPTASIRTGERRRIRARVQGTVQGVGFRPYVFHLASELGLGGYVLNDELGVLVEVEGPPGRVEEFLARLGPEAPPMAAVGRVDVEEAAVLGEGEFRIAASERGAEADVPISPDAATCSDCLRELLDPADRRYRYPFINCTNCGPRFTIVRGVPYDRPRTTMASFAMCAACTAEYEDPLDRRFHAQPNACPECGPRARLVDAAGRQLAGNGHRDAVAAAAAEVAAGRIIAVKGMGGFHLACRADDEAAVAALRGRKHREDKPFALMAPSLASARELVELSERDEALLAGREAPIVIARRRSSAPVADAAAPRSGDLGVMLPYSPLHHLLLRDAGATLVMTSGNVSDEPIAYRDAEAVERLSSIADAFLVHDRPIHMRTDDSVVRSIRGGMILLRRSRGYVPREIELPFDGRAALGCGAELKNTFCLAKGRRAWVGHHIGDLKNYETLRSMVEAIAHFERLFCVEPEVVAHDLHPDYLSTRYALDRSGVDPVGVQHHHAHLAACLAEHSELGDAVGAIYDGSGFGADGSVWGGELLAGDIGRSERIGLLLPVPLPGGDAAVREPWRMACSWLGAISGDDPPPLPRGLAADVDPAAWGRVSELARARAASPLTSSVGRLFDAIAALCGVCTRVNYEGQAAAELEAASDPGQEPYPLPLVEGGGIDGAPDSALVLDARETIAAVLRDLGRGEAPARIGGRFHAALAAASASALEVGAERTGSGTAVLSGGAFQNRILLEATRHRLLGAGLRVLVPQRLPPNDGGIAFGQVAAARAREPLGMADPPR
jgi:hydrogenase maturation protein HypF